MALLLKYFYTDNKPIMLGLGDIIIPGLFIKLLVGTDQYIPCLIAYVVSLISAITANNLSGNIGTKFSVVRYGNVFGSRGSAIPVFYKQQKNQNYFTVTNKEMTRFSITLDESVKFVIKCINIMKGGEIFVPKIPSYRITDVIKAFNPKMKIKIIGVRPGEKIHEEMITTSDSYNTVDLGDYYAILPQKSNYSKEDYKEEFGAVDVPRGFSYDSGNNTKWETVESLRKLVKIHVDPNFKA